MKKKKIIKRSVAPIYAAAATWLAWCLFAPLYAMWHIIAAAAATAAVYAVFKLLLYPNKVTEIEVEEEQPKEAPKVLPPAVAAVFAEGEVAMKELDRLKKSIKNGEVGSKITQIMILTDKIVKDAEHDPSDIPQIKRFLNYYTPTTIKLLNAYDRMSEQGFEGGTLEKSKKRIEDMLDEIIKSNGKQLDALFANEVMDIETDMDVLEGMMKRQGLGDKDFQVKRGSTN